MPICTVARRFTFFAAVGKEGRAGARNAPLPLLEESAKFHSSH
jgi:hypothetical protein